MEDMIYCGVNMTFLLLVELIQQPLKDVFRVCGQSYQAPYFEPWRVLI